MKIPVLLAVMLALPLAASPARAQIHCPDQRATNIPPRIHYGDVTYCRFGVVIFGVHIGVGGPPCPRKKWTIPAHQECLGAENVGTYCRAEGSLPVQLELCECRTLGQADFGITLPECVCHAVSGGGTVEDFETVNCAPST